MKRNDFLKKGVAGLVAVVGITLAAFSRKKEDKEQPKPPLTPGNLNRFFEKYEHERPDRSLNEAITDARTFVDKYFTYISPQQKERIGRITKEEWEGIQAILRDLKRRKGKVEFEFINKPGELDIAANCEIVTRLLNKNIGAGNVELKKFLIQ